MVTKEKAVVCAVDDPTPIAYLNVYEEGDIWVKVQGCEACPEENRKKCCGNCPMWGNGGCFWHLGVNRRGSSKPWTCVVKPCPDTSWEWCSLEFRCVRGSRKGQIRRVREPKSPPR